MKTLVLHSDFREARQRRRPVHALAEAVSLAMALSLDVVGEIVVPLPKARAGTLFGTGKVAEIKAICEADEVGLVIVDGPVTPVQQRNLEKEWNVKLLDRTGLILEIFGDRARTREGVLQVDLAHLVYQKSRLVRSWTHLERQRGALSFVGGPGETQIEADRRLIEEQIQRIRKSLATVVKTRKLHRAARKKVPYPIVALVGYTNSGKSTLFNRLTGAEVLTKDMLFATLDPTMRAVSLPSGRKVILSDTVGFISDLPTQLVAAFRATLEEVLDADLILHVRDIAHPETEAQRQDVDDILTDLGISAAAQTRIVEVLNKIDLLPAEAAQALEQGASREAHKVATSATTGRGMAGLIEVIEQSLAEPKIEEKLTLGFDEGRARAWLFDQKLVSEAQETETGYIIDVSWTERQRDNFRENFAATVVSKD